MVGCVFHVTSDSVQVPSTPKTPKHGVFAGEGITIRFARIQSAYPIQRRFLAGRAAPYFASLHRSAKLDL